ncbi:hypothetical protein MNBD_GAMMA02-778 [hydrothermal vent metagenome]|uniref:Uncharacterized protein n=1 Tax=hydrothermal vent metagenome TaxID=652676 RepID=A0A3B0VS37_9ZZZZ
MKSAIIDSKNTHIIAVKQLSSMESSELRVMVCLQNGIGMNLGGLDV